VFVFSRYSLNFLVEELKNPNRSVSLFALGIIINVSFGNFK